MSFLPANILYVALCVCVCVHHLSSYRHSSLLEVLHKWWCSFVTPTFCQVVLTGELRLFTWTVMVRRWDDDNYTCGSTWWTFASSQNKKPKQLVWNYFAGHSITNTTKSIYTVVKLNGHPNWCFKKPFQTIRMIHFLCCHARGPQTIPQP